MTTVEGLQIRGHLHRPEVRAALERLPRWEFVGRPLSRAVLEAAVEDAPMSIGHGQTISAPHMVAILLEAADVRNGARCLEVGAGSGWLAVVLADLVGLAGRVVAIEIVPELVELARQNVQAHEVADRVQVLEGDGGLGLPASAQYDVVIVSCAAPHVPRPLLDQLDMGGRLVIPIGDHSGQDLVRLTRTTEGFARETLGKCSFVPLLGRHGFYRGDN